MQSKLTTPRTMQLSIATLSAILATLAQASPVPQSAQAAQVQGVQSAQISGAQGAQVQAAPQPATVTYAQPQPQKDDGDNSQDNLDVLGHAKLLNGDGINVLGGPTAGGNTKRQEDNSKDSVDALGHAELLNNDGINVLGHGAKGGDNVDAPKPAPVHVEQPQPQPQPVYVENVQSKPQPKPQPKPQSQPANNPPTVVGPSFNANQVQQVDQQSAVNA